ncbi:MAG: oligopeptide ABC transporter permease OppB [Woeseiaceae bacterium]|nr:oligopeptide ABC transporter permease OppB [Woeseiaceae bacterium]
MLAFALRRLLAAIPTLFFVILIAFLMVHAAPGGPFDSERALPPEIEANVAAAYRLDEPLPAQFVRYLGGVVTGDFGPSYRYRDYTVAELIAGALPVSVLLGGLAMILALAFGIAAGSAAALYRGSWLDRGIMASTMIGISIPVFVVAPLFVLLFAVTLRWLPAGWSGADGTGRLVLPVVALALPQVAYIARLLRASLIDVLGSDFIRTARAAGLPMQAVLFTHALKPAILPVLSYLGPAVASILTGSVVVEQIFGIPGLGQLFVTGALNRDYTLVLGIVIFYAALIVLMNLLVDLLYGAIDPRIRYS